MKARIGCALTMSALLLTACGGGGGGGGVSGGLSPTSISGTVTPPSAPAVRTNDFSTTDVRIGASQTRKWNSITQTTNYTLSGSSVTSLTMSAVNLTGYLEITTGATPYAGDATLGQLTSITNSTNAAGNGTYTSTLTTGGASLTQDTSLAALQTAKIQDGSGSSSAYVLPAAVNASGYTYQTFGSWATVPSAGVVNENYFSAGLLTDPGATALPGAGTAIYTGKAAGSLVIAATQARTNTIADMSSTVSFGARTVAFTTTNTTSNSVANANLNLSGTLSYSAGSNTFTGTITNPLGMSGNATGSFYGPASGTVGTNQANSPPEIGGTYAVTGTVGVMQGAFGGKLVP